MWNYIKDEAIILKRINYKDADRILTLYTKNNGKISANARGIRKLLSKKRSHLELFNYTSVYVIKTGDRHLITQAELINPFSKLKTDYKLTTWGYYAVEIFEKMVPEDDNNSIIFDLLHKTLKYIDLYGNPNILNGYNLKLLKILGFYSKSKSVSDYKMDIEKLTFEEILKLNYPSQLIEKEFGEIRNITEDIIESKIKTDVIF